MSLIYVGIDEAGYGPLLGPLVVGRCAFRCSSWTAGAPAPNLWRLLKPAVCRKGGDKRGRIAIDDSKKLKGANDLPEPLRHLERAVLTALAVTGKRPTTDTELWAALGCQIEPHEWYRGDSLRLPAYERDGESAGAKIGIDANQLSAALDAASVEVLDLSVIVIGETAFNHVLSTEQNKAATTGLALSCHLQQVWDAWSKAEGIAEGGPRVVCDRQGGRTDYTDALKAWLPEVGEAVKAGRGKVHVLEQSENASRYHVDAAPGAMHVSFHTDSESLHLPIALASMACKLTRELLMRRFNRYWTQRALAAGVEIKPTAGYTLDARRWLNDMKPVVTREERHAMIRRA